MPPPRPDRRRLVCASCGYELIGLAADDRCPECGSTERRLDDPRAVEFGHWSVWSPIAAHCLVAVLAYVCVQFIGNVWTRSDLEAGIFASGVLMAPAAIAVGAMALAPVFKSVRPVIGIAGASLSLTCSIWMAIWAAQYLPSDAQAPIGVLFASFYAFWIVIVLAFAVACIALLLRRVC